MKTYKNASFLELQPLVVRMTVEAAVDICHIVDYPQDLIQFYPHKWKMDAQSCFFFSPFLEQESDKFTKSTTE